MARPCILVVDDSEDNRQIYATLLEHHGYRVVAARDGEEGVRLAREVRPAAIVMDISMPVLSGWGAMRELDAAPETARIPVIALTANDQPHDRRRAREAGFSVFLSKPCRLERLLGEVRRLVGPGIPAGG